MKAWLKISCLLCVFGFVREIRPSEPYVTEYLLGEWRNITQEQLNREVYPIGTYSYLAQLVVVFLITDFLRYKPLIIVIGVAGIITWSLLIWTTSLLALQILEFTFGTYMAAEVAYYTYIYAKVDKKYYPRVTSHTRAAMFSGKLVAGISAQILVTFELMDYKELNYITLTTQIIATIWAFGLPKVNSSMYFHRRKEPVSTVIPTQDIFGLETNGSVVSKRSEYKRGSQESQLEKFMTPPQLLWTHFRNAYTNLKVVQWSIWYTVGLCGYLQIISYIQVLWNDIDPNPTIAWNGAVEAVLTALSALSALAAGYLHAERLRPITSLLILSVLSMLEGSTILMSCLPHNIYFSYAGYILFGCLYAFTITVASAEVARHLEEDSFGLVFGINTLAALLLQTILTLVVISEYGYALDVVGQYTVYALYFIIIGGVYMIFVIIEYFVFRSSEASFNLAS